MDLWQTTSLGAHYNCGGVFSYRANDQFRQCRNAWADCPRSDLLCGGLHEPGLRHSPECLHGVDRARRCAHIDQRAVFGSGLVGLRPHRCIASRWPAHSDDSVRLRGSNSEPDCRGADSQAAQSSLRKMETQPLDATCEAEPRAVADHPVDCDPCVSSL